MKKDGIELWLSEVSIDAINVIAANIMATSDEEKPQQKDVEIASAFLYLYKLVNENRELLDYTTHNFEHETIH